MEAKHTTTPWEWEETRHANCQGFSEAAGGMCIAEKWGACNAHEELLKALKRMLPIAVGALAFIDCEDAIRAARAAIAKAEGL